MRQLELGPERILVTGWRQWRDRVLLERELIHEAVVVRGGVWNDGRLVCDSDKVLFILGDAEGADELARQWCIGDGVPFIRFEVDPRRPSPERYRERSRRMVDLGKPTRFVAFWAALQRDGEPDGTLDTMRRCVRAGVPGRIVPP